MAFGGVVIEGSPYAALRRVLLAFQCSLNESECDDRWHNVEFCADHFRKFGRTFERIWYRRKVEDRYCEFVSLDPAEFRTTLPDNGIIVDVPKGTPRVSCRQILESVVGACESYAPPMVASENELLATAKRLLARENGRVEASFKSDIRAAMVCSDKSAMQTAVDDLYKTYLFKGTYNIVEFTAAMALVRLQWETGRHIEQDWVADPVAPLVPFFNRLYDSADSRTELLESSIEICNLEHCQARSELKAALMDESWDMSSRKLRIACHKFFIVNFFRGMFEHHKIWPVELEFSPVLAEEALVCTLHGITSGAQFCAPNPETMALSLLRVCPDIPTFPSLRDLARRDASEIRPVFARFFADVLAAQALTLIRSPTHIREGIAKLEEIKASLRAPETEFERGWIDHALLKAYGELNDKEALMGLAAQITGRLLVRNVMSKVMSKDL